MADLQHAIAEVKRAYTTTRLTRNVSVPQSALDTILNAILSGDLIPRADAAEAHVAALTARVEGLTGAITFALSEYDAPNDIDEAMSKLRTELAQARADALAEVQRLREAVEALVVVLDRNDKKGPIPDVEMMFCWLAAQNVRAAFRKIAPKGEAT